MQDLIEAIREKLEVDVSPETIQKDIAAMREPYPDGYDAPIRYDFRRKGYEYTDPDYSISGVSLNSDDVTAIKEAMDFIDAIGGSRVSERFNQAVEKMFTSITEDFSKDERSANIIQTQAAIEARGFEHFDKLFKAAREKIPVSMLHYSYSKRIFKSTILHPILLKEFDNRWYVIGYSERHQSLHTFGFDRIYAPELVMADFYSVPSVEVDNYQNDVYGVYPLQDWKKEHIVLSSSPLITNYFRAQKLHPSQHIELKNNGAADVHFDLIPSYDLVRMILSYGKEVRVIAPLAFNEFIQSMQA
jgi:predicted DNA-binding transcriptional regulator YafY